MIDKKIIYSVVIPVYNESSNVTELHRRLKKILEEISGLHEIIFVNDGSTDNSFSLLRDIAFSDHEVIVLCFDKNYGQHKAVTAGILEARGEYIITMDSDLQNPPEELPKLIAKIKEGYDMVSGYRRHRKDSAARRIPSLLTNFLISSITGLEMKDFGSMLRIFKSDTAKALAKEFMRTEGYITMLLARVTRNVTEIEVGHSERCLGKSKYNTLKLFSCLFRILFYYNDSFRKLLKKEVRSPAFIIDKKIECGKEAAATL